MSSPTLSVLLPNYNHADYLPRCLDAILGQSFRDFELIIVDDASTDDSVRVIESYARKDSRIRFYRNPQNRGVVPTLNRALELARGEFAHGAASDDYVLPGYFQDAVDLLRQHPQAGLALGLTDCVNDDGRLMYTVPGMWSDEAGYLSPDVLATRVTGCGVPGPAVWRRELFLKTGGYNPELKWHCDWFALQVVAFRHGVCFLPQKTTVVRMTDGGYSVSGQSRPKTQRPVLQRLLTELVAPQHQDVLPALAASGAMKQFGPELVRAVILMDNPPTGIVGAVRELVLAHAATMLRESDPEIRRAMAGYLPRYGPVAFQFYPQLGVLLTDPDLGVRTAATAARRAVRRALPFRTLFAYQARRVAGRTIRTLDRLVRPLHHDRMEKVEAALAQLVASNHQIYSALSEIYHSLERNAAALRERQAAPDPAEPARSRAA